MYYFSKQAKANKHEKVCIRVTKGIIAEQKKVKYLGVTVDKKLFFGTTHTKFG